MSHVPLRVAWIFNSGLFKKSLCSPLCRLGRPLAGGGRAKPPEVVFEPEEIDLGGLGRHVREIPSYCCLFGSRVEVLVIGIEG